MPAQRHDISELIWFRERPDGSMVVEPRSARLFEFTLLPTPNPWGGTIEADLRAHDADGMTMGA